MDILFSNAGTDVRIYVHTNRPPPRWKQGPLDNGCRELPTYPLGAFGRRDQ